MGDNTAARKQLQLHHNPVIDVSLNVQGGSNYIDDDGRPKRTGTVWTASSHIITAVVGSGVLSLTWAIAQLGWIAGPVVMVMFSIITYHTSTLLVSCYRDPVTGKRNCTYSDAVRSHLGEFCVNLGVKMCGFIQQLTLFGATTGYTVTASISMVAIKRSNCFHNSGGKDPCHASYYPYMLAFGIPEIILSQIPNFDKLSWFSIVAAVMSFTYSGIGLALGVAKVAENGKIKGSMTGMSTGAVTPAQKMWRTFQALGNIAFAYSYSIILIEIQTMKKATRFSLAVTSIFYILCGCTGYAAFGDIAPGNLLTDRGLSKPIVAHRRSQRRHCDPPCWCIPSFRPTHFRDGRTPLDLGLSYGKSFKSYDLTKLLKTAPMDRGVGVIDASPDFKVEKLRNTHSAWKPALNSQCLELSRQNADIYTTSKQLTQLSKANVVVYNALIDAFCKANKFKNVHRVSNDTNSKGLPQETEEVFSVFHKVWKYMKLKQFVPSMHTSKYW
ncbi:hypothetical protein ACFX13_019690 [Malus domestica]